VYNITAGGAAMRLKQTTEQILKVSILGIGISAVAFMLFQYIGFFNSTNNLLLDQFLIHADSRQPDKRLLVIEIDDESISKLGNLGNSLPRDYYVKLIQKLSLFGAKTIAFDIIFIDEKYPDTDSQLAFATDSTGHVIHCFVFSNDETNPTLFQDTRYEKYSIQINDETDLNLITAWNATLPDKRFIDSFNLAGYANAGCDYDGRLRRFPLFIEFNDMLYPGLGITALLDYYGATREPIKIEKTFWGRQAIIETPTEIIKIPINSKGEVLLNFYGKFDAFEPTPLHEIVNLLDLLQPKDSSKISLPSVDEKIVLIGNSETGMDIRTTPFSVNFPGVGIHATFISNLLNGDLITEVSWKINAIISAILCLLLLSIFIYYQKFSKRMRIFSVIAILLFIMFNLAAFFLLFDNFRIWLKLVQIDCVFMLLFVSLLFYEKVIRLNELNSRIDQLENNISSKKAELSSLNKRINSQTEQYDFMNVLEKSVHPELADQPPEHLANVSQRKDLLWQEIDELRKQKEIISTDIKKLEHDRRTIKGIANRNPATEAKPDPEKQKMNKVQKAKEIMQAWQYFQLKQRRTNSHPNSTFGMIAMSQKLDETDKTAPTAMGEIFRNLKNVANYNSSVFITGDHGTGKGLIAKAIHEQSTRTHKEFVTINCAAIPETLLETILFGHEKGAFTGAQYDHKGKFEYANGGTIFLDEIGDMKLDLQAKLLRVLEEREIQKVGSNRTINVDVRVITATNKNLKECIKNNKFREDLFYRLNVVNFHIPPLKERKGDIPFLVKHFLDELNKQYNKDKSFSGDAIIAAMCYDWPGNVRDLQHLVENVYVLTSENMIDLLALPDYIQAAYRNIFESEEVPLWSQIEETVHQEKERLLDACKIAIKENNIEEFLKSNDLQANHETQANCYKYLLVFVNGMASIFSQDKRELLVRKTIVQMQKQLFQWCREEKIAKLSDVYDTIEKLLGRGKRTIDNWR